MKYPHIFSVVAVSMFFAFIPTIAMEQREKGIRRDSRPLTMKQTKQSIITKQKKATIKDIEKFNRTKKQTIDSHKKNRRISDISSEEADETNSR